MFPFRSTFMVHSPRSLWRHLHDSETRLIVASSGQMVNCWLPDAKTKWSVCLMSVARRHSGRSEGTQSKRLPPLSGNTCCCPLLVLLSFQCFHLFVSKPLLKLHGNLKYMTEVKWILKMQPLLYWFVVVAWWLLEWSIDWIYDDLKILTTSEKDQRRFYGIIICLFFLLEHFPPWFPPQSCSCNWLHLKPLPHSNSVRWLYLSTLGHPECYWTQHFPRTHRLHSLWRPQQAQHRSVYYRWAGNFFFNVRGVGV